MCVIRTLSSGIRIEALIECQYAILGVEGQDMFMVWLQRFVKDDVAIIAYDEVIYRKGVEVDDGRFDEEEGLNPLLEFAVSIY
mmetsp:Transcript_14243/g.25757  ORF Transcript_14243/g.25757 Transcript_14243/m.25757 type:complete len:83 (+) Transcript_14243:166-414(+)